MNTDNDSQIDTPRDHEEIAKIITNFSDEIIFEFYYSSYPAKDISAFNSIDDLRSEVLSNLKNNNYNLSKIQTDLINSPKIRIKIPIEEYKNESRTLIYTINYIINCNDKFIIRKDQYNKYLPSNSNPYLLLLKILRENNINNSNFTNISMAISKYFKNKEHYKLSYYLNDKGFIEWLKQYFSNNSIDERVFNHYDNDKHTKDYVLSVLDFKLMKSESDYIFLINRIKKSWQQKNYKEGGKEKKKYHLPLTKKSKSELTKLSEIRNCSEAKVLEDLINYAYVSEYCDENGKPKY